MTFGIVPHNSKLYWKAVDLRDELLRKPLGLAFTAKELELEHDQFHFIALQDKTNVIATLVVKQLTRNKFKFRQVCVAENQQGKQIGKQLNQFVESYLCSRGKPPIVLELHARKNVVGYYESLGFEVIGDEFLEIGIPHQKMVKQLS